VPHGKEGDGQARAKEDDEVGGQLVPVVDGEGQVISWSRQSIASPPGNRGAKPSGRIKGCSGNAGEHSSGNKHEMSIDYSSKTQHQSIIILSGVNQDSDLTKQPQWQDLKNLMYRTIKAR